MRCSDNIKILQRGEAGVMRASYENNYTNWDYITPTGATPLHMAVTLTICRKWEESYSHLAGA